MLLIAPLGRIADRIGRGRVGDSIFAAHTSSVSPTHARTSGLAFLSAVIDIMRLLDSVLFGAVWTWYGEQSAAIVFTIALLITIVVARTYFLKGPDIYGTTQA